MLKRITAILKLLMAKLLKQDLMCLPSALLDRREKHLECSVTSMQDRLTNLGEGEVDFITDNNQVERLVNNLMATKAVVGVVILVNRISVKEQMGNISECKEDIDEDSMISARESREGREDAWMETPSSWLALLSTFRFVKNAKYSISPR